MEAEANDSWHACTPMQVSQSINNAQLTERISSISRSLSTGYERALMPGATTKEVNDSHSVYH